jgi:DNA-binding Lrp family transcriptional regulator
LDAFDRKIIALVQTHNRRTTVEIADQVGLSRSAVHRRLSALRESGVLMADVAIPDPKRLGPFLTFILTITMRTDKASHMRRLERAMRETAEVQQCYHVTGSSDFIAIVNVRSQDHFSEVTEALLYSNPDVSRFETCLVVERTKLGLTLPIEP